MKSVAVILARGGSKGIPQKNIIPLNNKPLLEYTITAAKQSNVNEVWVSTDCENIKSVAIKLGVNVLDRPKKFATDSSKSEEALLHFYNTVIEAKGNILLIDQIPPSQWAVSLPDLSSRVVTALVVEILPPDDALLAAILVKLLTDRQLIVGAEVIEYVVARMERSFAAAGDLVVGLDRLALAEKREITIPLAKKVLNDDF